MTRKPKFITAADLRADPSPLLHNPKYFIDRLEAAEAVALLFGRTASRRHESFRDRATYALWSKWLDLVGGNDFASPRHHPHLQDKELREIVEADEALERRTREKLERVIEEVPAWSDPTP